MYHLIADGYDSNQLTESVEDILGQTKFLTMATASLDGEPWANTVCFATSESLTLYVITYPDSKHMQNLTENNRLALNILDTSQDGRKRQGLQLAATYAPIGESDWDSALTVWGTRIMGADRVPKLIQDIKGWSVRPYELTINSVKIFDETRFGTEVWVRATVNR